MNRSAVFVLALLVLAAAGCGSRQQASLVAEQNAIRTTDASWLAAATSRDLERTLPFWSDDATIFAPDSPPIRGKAAIRQYVSNAFAIPGFSINWKTDKVEVSQSGDLAYSTGTDWITAPGPDGKPVTRENNSVAIWKKQPDSSWKCVVDVMTPAPAPALPASRP